MFHVNIYPESVDEYVNSVDKLLANDYFITSKKL